MKYNETKPVDDRIKLCKECYHCKVKNGKISCKEGYFENISIYKLLTITPYDFDCLLWEGF